MFGGRIGTLSKWLYITSRLEGWPPIASHHKLSTNVDQMNKIKSSLFHAFSLSKEMHLQGRNVWSFLLRFRVGRYYALHVHANFLYLEAGTYDLVGSTR